jgi:hypothetical protein
VIADTPGGGLGDGAILRADHRRGQKEQDSS